MKKIKNPFLDDIPECGFPEDLQEKYETHIVYGQQETKEEAVKEMEKLADVLTDFMNGKKVKK